MRHTIYAAFDDPRQATAAVAMLERAGAKPDHDCSLIMHESALASNDLPYEETALREGLADGALLGAGAGALIGGIVLGPMGLIGAGFLVPALFGAGVGSVYGALAGALGGAGSPDPELERLALHIERGGVVVTYRARDLAARESAEQVLRSHGGEVARKPIFDTGKAAGVA